MKPLQQTKFNVPDKTHPSQIKTYGNCVAACVASIMECEIYAVPNVETLMFCYDWFDVLKKWLWFMGWDICKADTTELKDGEPYIVSGNSPRGMNSRHWVIYRDGKMIHDPHISGAGVIIDDEIGYYRIYKKAE